MGFFQTLTTWVCTTVDLGSFCTGFQQPILHPSFPAIDFRPPTHAPALPLPPNQHEFFCNTPTDRRCWLEGPAGWDYFGIETDYEQRWPRGVLREVSSRLSIFFIAKASSDGVERIGQVVNGTYPGPLLEANWGDTLRIHVTNYLTPELSPSPVETAANGTTLHWHGIRQYRSSESDGVNGVTQCPIAPRQNYTYEFKAMQYGHTWYHSHYSLQYPDGLYGPLVIHGPTSANWDIDLGVLQISDWIHLNAFVVFSAGELGPSSTNSNATVINGHGIYPCLGTDLSPSSSCTGPGSRYTAVFQRGKKYLLRLVNTSADMQFRFSIDNHMLEVVQADFVPIVPFFTPNISIGIGQRYTIVPHTRSLAHIWVLRYSYSPTTDPVSHPYNETYYTIPTLPECLDIDRSLLTPVVPWEIGAPADTQEYTVARTTFNPPSSGPHGFNRWEVGGAPMWLDWANPAIVNLDNTTWNDEYDVTVENGGSGGWVYFIIQGIFKTHPGRRGVRVAHPIHLHGHDFAILQQGPGEWDALDPKPNLTLSNPARRDVALLDAGGYLVIAFRTDNPGVWLMHCHIAWHASSGLALQVVERQSEIQGTIVREKQLTDTCQKWKDFRDRVVVFQDDSGI
ncbi:multicopper oxidase-domain-containing protein [Trichophaea hybrida]|nr:multicopper oxidase-domain-containing protein [Trichophaea hybrida]